MLVNEKNYVKKENKYDNGANNSKVLEPFISDDYVNKRNNSGNTALICASCNGYDKTVMILIDAGANIDAKNGQNDTALMYASFNGHYLVAKVLVDAKADLNVVNKHNNTVLMYASCCGHNEVAMVLIEAGADVNVINIEGDSALTFAVKNKNTHENTQLVKLLINSRANVGIVNKEGNYSDEIKELLRQHQPSVRNRELGENASEASSEKSNDHLANDMAGLQITSVSYNIIKGKININCSPK